MTVVPIGKVNSTTSCDSFAFSFATFIETHIVALLDEVENATSIASFTFKKYLRGWNHHRKYPILGRVMRACIASPKSDTPAKGRSFIILSTQLCATTQDTIANTHIGVSFMTQDIKIRIPLLIVCVKVFNWRTSSLFPYDMRATHSIIPMVTICIAFKSINATIILSGMIESKNPEKLRASNLWGEKFSKSKLTPSHGLNTFIRKREVVIAIVVVSI